MFRAHASSGEVIGLTALAILVVFSILLNIYFSWPFATRTNPREADVLVMILLMGALGGALHWTSSFAVFVGDGRLLRRWIPYYVLMPFEGAGLALVIYLVLWVGILSPTNPTPENARWINFYAFAGLTGLFAKQAISMLADVFAIIFKKIQAKDSLETDKAKTGGAAGQKP